MTFNNKTRDDQSWLCTGVTELSRPGYVSVLLTSISSLSLQSNNIDPNDFRIHALNVRQFLQNYFYFNITVLKNRNLVLSERKTTFINIYWLRC